MRIGKLARSAEDVSFIVETFLSNNRKIMNNNFPKPLDAKAAEPLLDVDLY